ncbi:MAG: porin [Candidatus Sedimenticola endophacoides]
MNKKIIALAVAAAFVAPAAMADTTLYGRINTHVVSSDDGTNDEWDVEDNASRIGVKGSEDLGNGMTAVYQIELDVDAENTGNTSGRLAYTGIAGGFGTVALGRQWTPYYGSVDKTDFNQVNGMNDTYIGTARVGNALGYVSPNFSGFTATLALAIDDDSSLDVGEDGIDAYNLSLDYSNGPLSVGFSLLDAGGTVDGKQWGIGAKYKMDSFALFAQYEDADFEIYNALMTATETADVDAYAIGVEAYFGNNTLRAKFGEVDTATDTEQWSIGLQHNFSKRTTAFAEYENNETGSTDTDRFGFGIRHDF